MNWITVILSGAAFVIAVLWLMWKMIKAEI